MDELGLGRTLRALRRRLGWRQSDVAARARVSQQTVSRVERGRLAGVPLATVQGVFGAVDASVALTVRWRGGQLDRILDERHADIVGQTATMLGALGWQVTTEVTFAEYAERGSIDLLAWHPPTRTLLVVEVKTEVASTEELQRRHDAKVRLAPEIWRKRGGERPAAVGRLLVVADGTTNRRRLARLGAAMNAAYPAGPGVVRQWLRDPRGPMSGVLLVGYSAGVRRTRGASPTRVRRAKEPLTTNAAEPATGGAATAGRPRRGGHGGAATACRPRRVGDGGSPPPMRSTEPVPAGRPQER